MRDSLDKIRLPCANRRRRRSREQVPRQSLRGWPRLVLLRGARSAPADRATPLARMRFPALALAKVPSPVPAKASRTDLPPKERHAALPARMSQRESPPRFDRLQKPVPPAFREVHCLLPGPEHSASGVPGPQARRQSPCCETSLTLNFGSSRLLGPWLTVGGWGGHLLSARFSNGLRSGLIEPQNKNPTARFIRRWDSRIARYDSRVFSVPAPEDGHVQQVQQRQACLVFWTLEITG